MTFTKQIKTRIVDKIYIEKRACEYKWKFMHHTLVWMALDLGNVIENSNNEQVQNYLKVELEIVLRAARKTKRLPTELKSIASKHSIVI